MDQEILQKFNEQNEKLDKIFKSTEKTRKYFLWTLIFTVVTFVAPLILFMVLIPKILEVYGGSGLVM